MDGLKINAQHHEEDSPVTEDMSDHARDVKTSVNDAQVRVSTLSKLINQSMLTV